VKLGLFGINMGVSAVPEELVVTAHAPPTRDGITATIAAASEAVAGL
jgi:hypothetical protein